ncbi:MAG TPA: hypothetical protein PLW39_01850, partial [Thermoflexales bacterium]|nr:hypothetical protein [Thermoflexales bacterium]
MGTSKENRPIILSANTRNEREPLSLTKGEGWPSCPAHIFAGAGAALRQAQGERAYYFSPLILNANGIIFARVKCPNVVLGLHSS